MDTDLPGQGFQQWATNYPVDQINLHVTSAAVWCQNDQPSRQASFSAAVVVSAYHLSSGVYVVIRKRVGYNTAWLIAGQCNVIWSLGSQWIKRN